jgi:hypothetical protein
MNAFRIFLIYTVGVAEGVSADGAEYSPDIDRIMCGM